MFILHIYLLCRASVDISNSSSTSIISNKVSGDSLSKNPMENIQQRKNITVLLYDIILIFISVKIKIMRNIPRQEINVSFFILSAVCFHRSTLAMLHRTELVIILVVSQMLTPNLHGNLFFRGVSSRIQLWQYRKGFNNQENIYWQWAKLGVLNESFIGFSRSLILLPTSHMSGITQLKCYHVEKCS